jgi:hypothetical protein
MVLLVLFGWLLISLGTFVTVATIHDIPLNPQSSLYDSIVNIWLDDIQRVVVIKMRVVRRCENPTFLVRLSGTALYWLKSTNRTTRLLFVKLALTLWQRGPTLTISRTHRLPTVETISWTYYVCTVRNLIQKTI